MCIFLQNRHFLCENGRILPCFGVADSVKFCDNTMKFFERTSANLQKKEYVCIRKDSFQPKNSKL